MAEIKTREKSKGIKALDKAVVAGERMKRAFVRSKDQAENLLDDGQISPSEYAEDKVRYMAEDTAREVGHEAGKLTGKAKLDTTPLITHRFPLSEIEEAYRIFENRLDGVIKVAITADKPQKFGRQ